MYRLQHPLKKVTHLFPSNPLLKIEILPRSPFSKFGRKFTPNPPEEKSGGGGGGGGGGIYNYI